MKKVKYLIVVCLVMLFLTGCVKFNATMDIKKDKSMEFKIIYAFDKSIFGDTSSLKEEDMSEAKKQGFTVTKYSEGNMEGFTLTKKIKNIDEVSTESDAEYDLSGMMGDSSDNKYLFKVSKEEDKNTYYAKLKFNASDSGLNMNDEEDETLSDESDDLNFDDDSNTLDDIDLSSMMATLDLSFSVNLPNSAISNNATKAENDNKNLTWKLGTDKQEYIEFVFQLSNNESNNNLLYLAIGGGLLLLIVIIIIIILKGKNKNKEVVNNNVLKEEKEDVNENVTPIEMPTPKPEPTLSNNENVE